LVTFLRVKENGVDHTFREQFMWLSPSIKVAVDFWADEAVEQYWIDSVMPCPCGE
jgi:hypothetical protein